MESSNRRIEERKELHHQIRNVNSGSFDQCALNLFRYQYLYNEVYSNYIRTLRGNAFNIFSITALEEIPFLPITAFKTNVVSTIKKDPIEIFTSSATGGSGQSQHYIYDIMWYEEISKKCFEESYGLLEEYIILALLPSYLERKGSSLIRMVNKFIEISGNVNGGFYLYNHEELVTKLETLVRLNQKVLLIGVSFALLDLAEKHKIDLSQVTVMETGGMKGRKEEMSRERLHEQLKAKFNVNVIHSEYGMTELLSQAYSHGNGIFKESPTMKIMIHQMTDPLSIEKKGKTGILSIIDLANIDSCAFLQTEDLGRKQPENSFEVLGRLDHSDVRGCNLMVGDLN